MEGEEKIAKEGIWDEFIRKRNSGYFDFTGEETSEVVPEEQSGCRCSDEKKGKLNYGKQNSGFERS